MTTILIQDHPCPPHPHPLHPDGLPLPCAPAECAEPAEQVMGVFLCSHLTYEIPDDPAPS